MCDSGDVFLLMDLPPNSTLGHDVLALTVADTSSLGVRDVPPGAHFLWTQAPGAMVRCGYWYVTKPPGPAGVLRVKQWNRYNEILAEPALEVEVRDAQKNLARLYPKLFPYNFALPLQSGRAETGSPGGKVAENPRPPPDLAGGSPAATAAARESGGRKWTEPNSWTGLWREVAGDISDSYLARVTANKTGREWLVDSAVTAMGPAAYSNLRNDEPGLSTGVRVNRVTCAELNFIFVPKKSLHVNQLVYDTDGSPAGAGSKGGFLSFLALSDRRQASFPHDLTTDIVTLVSSGEVTDADLLAELQFTFITGLHINNYACIEHWWEMVLRIVLCSYQLVIERPALSRRMLETLHLQLEYNDRFIASPSLATAAATAPFTAPSDDSHRATFPDATTSVPADDGTIGGGILNVIPPCGKRLRGALAAYKRHLEQVLLSLGDKTTPDQQATEAAFRELEAWAWRHGWDLLAVRGDGEDKPPKKGGGDAQPGGSSSSTGGSPSYKGDRNPVTVAATTAIQKIRRSLAKGNPKEEEEEEEEEEFDEYEYMTKNAKANKRKGKGGGGNAQPRTSVFRNGSKVLAAAANKAAANKAATAAAAAAAAGDDVATTPPPAPLPSCLKEEGAGNGADRVMGGDGKDVKFLRDEDTFSSVGERESAIILGEGKREASDEYSDEDDYEPVIVDLDEDGREVGLISFND